MIELKEVTKEYSKGVAALNGINLKIDQGERSESEPDEAQEDPDVPERDRSSIPGFPSVEGSEYL